MQISEARLLSIFVIKTDKSIQSFSSESLWSRILWFLILKLFLDRWRNSRGKLFQFFTPYIENDLICLSILEGLKK